MYLSVHSNDDFNDDIEYFDSVWRDDQCDNVGVYDDRSNDEERMWIDFDIV